MGVAERVRRLIPELESALAHGSDHRQLRQQMLRFLRRHVPFEGACAATIDPVTVMWTDCELFEAQRDPRFEELVFDAEYRQTDLAPMCEIARREVPVSILSLETRGDLARSVRYRIAYEPAGIGDELRLPLVSGGLTWGSLQLARGGRGKRFSAEQGEALAALSAPLARVLRLALLKEASAHADCADAPGVLLMKDGRLLEASPSASALLGAELPRGLPAGVHHVVACAQRGQTSSARCPGPRGGWLVLHGTPLGDRVAILVERATPLMLAEVVRCGLGLTGREGQVLAEVARGRSTKEIAAQLRITDWTVQDHLKSIFQKVGVSSRQELVAAVFFGYWAPEHRNGASPSPFGHFHRHPRSLG